MGNSGCWHWATVSDTPASALRSSSRVHSENELIYTSSRSRSSIQQEIDPPLDDHVFHTGSPTITQLNSLILDVAILHWLVVHSPEVAARWSTAETIAEPLEFLSRSSSLQTDRCPCETSSWQKSKIPTGVSGSYLYFLGSSGPSDGSSEGLPGLPRAFRAFRRVFRRVFRAFQGPLGPSKTPPIHTKSKGTSPPFLHIFNPS